MTTFAACSTKVDLAIALDASGSIGKDNFRKELDFARDLIYNLNIDNGDRVAVETFSNSATVSIYYINLFKHL